MKARNSILIKVLERKRIRRIKHIRYVYKKEAKEMDSITQMRKTPYHIAMRRKVLDKLKVDKSKIIFVLNRNRKVVFGTTELDCMVYTDIDNELAGYVLYQRVCDLIKHYDFNLEKEGPTIKRSFYKEFKIKLKSYFTSEDFDVIKNDIERAVRLTYIEKIQSEVDLNEAKAVGELMEATKIHKNIIIRIGSLVFIKFTEKGAANFFLEKLSNTELNRISKENTLFSQPYLFWKKLQEIREQYTLENNKQEHGS